MPARLLRSSRKWPAESSALFVGALKSGPRMHSRKPASQTRVSLQLTEHLCHFRHKAHLNVCAAERIPDEELTAFQRAVAIAEVIGKLAVDARVQWRGRVLQTGNIEVQHQRQHRRALGVMHPLIVR